MDKKELENIKKELNAFIEYMCMAMEIEETKNSAVVKAHPKMYEILRELIPEYLRGSLKVYLEALDKAVENQNEITK